MQNMDLLDYSAPTAKNMAIQTGDFNIEELKNTGMLNFGAPTPRVFRNLRKKRNAKHLPPIK